MKRENVTVKSPADRKYRVIQWGVGNVGTVALRHFVHNPAYELVGVLCNRPEKIGKDAGELCGKAPTGARDQRQGCDRGARGRPGSMRRCGLIPTRCAGCCGPARMSSPRVAHGGIEPSTAKRIPTRSMRRVWMGDSFIAGGVDPGFAGDLLVLTLAHIVSQIDTIHIYEAAISAGTP